MNVDLDVIWFRSKQATTLRYSLTVFDPDAKKYGHSSQVADAMTAIILATCSHGARSGTCPESEPSPHKPITGCDCLPEVEGENSKFIYTKIGEMPSQFIQTCAGLGLYWFNVKSTI